jgi:hypothetical protein
VTIGEWHTDLDQTGGKMDRPGLEKAIHRIEIGQTHGLVVARWDRFARTLAGALQTIERIDQAGGALASVAEGIDPTTSIGRSSATCSCCSPTSSATRSATTGRSPNARPSPRDPHRLEGPDRLPARRGRPLVPHPQHAPSTSPRRSGCVRPATRGGRSPTTSTDTASRVRTGRSGGGHGRCQHVLIEPRLPRRSPLRVRTSTLTRTNP